MHLTLDFGNSKIKAHLFHENKCVDQYQGDTLEEIKTSVSDHLSKIEAIIYSDVSGQFDTQGLALFSTTPCYSVRSMKWPFISQYATPKTLGEDRIALVAAAVRLATKNAVLVFDAGTCLTADIMTADNHYLGGSISPGLQMRFKSLKQFTGSLPLVAFDDAVTIPGNSTETSMQAGVYWGMVDEIDGQIDRLKKKFPALTVILTGGDAHRLSKRVKNSIFVAPNFLAEGLDYLLTHNIKSL